MNQIVSDTTTFDYIVVGAGTAGSVIAARLSENPERSVLLIEAGARDALPEMAIPSAWPTLFGSSADWGDTTVVQEFSRTALPVPRGRTLGGSSSTNAMLFARGHRASYDAWVDQGAKGWGYDDLVPYFRRSETTQGRDAAVRGIDGPLTVGPTAEPCAVIGAGLAAAAQVGYETARDISSGLETGFGLVDCNVENGTRQSAADAYLRPVLDRANLHVVTDALVRRIIVADGVATGVEYAHTGVDLEARASREVILTAGAIGSAHLLLASGIGPAEHLTDVGVEVVLDLPGVGANLHDHPMSTVVYSAEVDLSTNADNIVGQAIGLVETEHATDGPDLQIVLINLPYASPALAGPASGFAIGFSAMTPRSRGQVRLTSPDITVGPLIDPNYLGVEHDVDVMAAGLAIARQIGEAEALSGWRDAEVQPGPDVDGTDSVRDYLQRSLVVYFHYAGTCRVGTDELAVVDLDLRVHGIDGLRVADASIMPSSISANTNATVYAIAERAAELIAG
ncbi:MAG: GMC family oxidoreductase N-terminal domain-containing protein [Mycobacterium sp.]